MQNEICAGIVLFNPDIARLCENIKAIINQVDIVFLQDNGSANISEVEDLMSELPKAILLKSSQNKGIAWGLNRLCERAANSNYQWILTLDQDSVCPEGMIGAYCKYLSDADMLCPKIVDRNYGILDGDNAEVTFVKKCITSGCLLNLNSWKKLCGFDEAMFIDGVDFEFCYRMIECGMKILRVNDVELNHEIGNITVRHFLGWKVIVKNHSAFRKYYIARNIIYMARKRKNVFLVMKGMLQEIKLVGIVILYENDRKEKIARIYKGICDGVKLSIDC